MNWCDAGFLGWRRHKDLAVLVVEACLKYAPDSIAGNFIQDSVRQVSNLASKLRRTPEQAFTAWAWEMCSRLRLHLNDRNGGLGSDNNSNNEKYMDFDLEAEVIGEGVAVKNPLACFVALQASQTGNVIDDVLERGFDQLLVLTSSGRYDHILEAIANIVPLFLPRPADLSTSEKFRRVVQSILSVDQTYLKMAKELVVSDFPGPILKELSNMMAMQITSYGRYGLHSPTSLMTLWLETLTKTTGWTANRGALYLIDYLCKEALASVSVFSEIVGDVKRVFQRMDEDLLANLGGNGFMSWLSSSSSGSSMLTPTISEFPNCAYFILTVEEERDEMQSFWPALVDNLAASAAVDEAAVAGLEKCVKKTMVENKSLPTYLSNTNNLPIYKWSQLILDCPADHPMQGILCQRFLWLFTAKAGAYSCRVGRHFFEGVVNSLYFGRIQTKIKAIEDHYFDMFDKEQDDKDKCLVDVFRAFWLWLKDDYILEENVENKNRSPHSLPDLMDQVFAKDLNWSVVDLDQAGCDRELSCLEWNRLHFRALLPALLNNATTTTRPASNPMESLIKRLSTYDCPLPMPSARIGLCGNNKLKDTDFTDPDTFTSAIRPVIELLKKFGRDFDDQRLEYGSHICAISELVNGLYINVDTELMTKGSCTGSKGPKGQKFECAGAAAICHRFSEARKQDVVDHKLTAKKSALTLLTEKILEPLPINLLNASSVIEEATGYILKMYFRHSEIRGSKQSSPPAGSRSFLAYKAIGISYFYTLFDCLGDETITCPALRNLLTGSLEQLGQAMIAEHSDQCVPLLERICSKPSLAHFLTPTFTPNCCTDPKMFLHIYKTINDLAESQSTLAFTLLSKVSSEIAKIFCPLYVTIYILDEN